MSSDNPLAALNVEPFLAPERVLVLEQSGKEELLNLMIDMLAATPQVKSADELKKAVFDREKLMSTGIGLNLGIPHARLKSISDMAVAVALVHKGIDDYESLDSQPVKLVFMIVARIDQNTQHLRLLSQLSAVLKDEKFREILLNSPNAEALYQSLTF